MRNAADRAHQGLEWIVQECPTSLLGQLEPDAPSVSSRRCTREIALLYKTLDRLRRGAARRHVIIGEG